MADRTYSGTVTLDRPPADLTDPNPLPAAPPDQPQRPPKPKKRGRPPGRPKRKRARRRSLRRKRVDLPVPEAIQEGRARLGWSQRDLATEMNAHITSISRWENGHSMVQSSRIAVLDYILRSVNVHADWAGALGLPGALTESD